MFALLRYWILALLFGNSQLVHGKHNQHLSYDHHGKVVHSTASHSSTSIRPNATQGKVFDWHDTELQALLWEGQEMVPSGSTPNGGELVERADRTEFGPAIPFKCIFCDNKRTSDSSLEMNMFTRDKMITRMKTPIRYDLDCVFYNQRPPGKIPHSLGETATEWGCNNGGRSIWVCDFVYFFFCRILKEFQNMWPYNKQTCGEENYYCLYEKCCWLSPLLQQGTPSEQQNRRLQYFGYMSAAFAATCRDRILIMSDDLVNVPYDRRPKPLGHQETGLGWQGRPVDPSIWLNDELPMLRELFRMGRISEGVWTLSPSGALGQKVNYILEREFTSNTKREEEVQPYEPSYNITELIEQADQARREWSALPEHERAQIIGRDEQDRINKRSTCGEALSYQPWNEDWFG